MTDNSALKFIKYFSGFAGGAGVLLAAAGFAPLAWLHAILDPLAPDGNMAGLDLPKIVLLRALVGVSGILLILAGTAARVWRNQAARFFGWVYWHLKDLIADNRLLRAELTAFRPTGWELVLLGLMAIAGIFARLTLLPGPMQYDESVTFLDYASRSFWAAISDYSLPNNHVFHTLLVHFSYRLLGDAPWVVRLPAFLAGILIIPATYFFCRAYYNRLTGWLAVGLVVWLPRLTMISANARGYTLITLLSLIIFTMANRALKSRRPAAWAWIALLSALGLFTIPVMVYPLGILYTWMLISLAAGETRQAYSTGRFLTWMFTCGTFTLLLPFLFYFPVIFSSGIKALVGNTFVRSLTWADFTSNLFSRLVDTGSFLSYKIPLSVIILLVFGWGLSLVFHRRDSNTKIPTMAAVVIFFAAALPLQRPQVEAKFFFFALPFLSIWAAAGWAGAFKRVPVKQLAISVTILASICLASASITSAWPNLPYLSGTSGELQETIAWIKPRLNTNDIILADFPIDAQIRYYARRAGLPPDTVNDRNRVNYSRAFVIVNPLENQTVQSVTAHQTLVLAPVDIQSASEQTVINNTHIYLALPLR